MAKIVSKEEIISRLNKLQDFSQYEIDVESITYVTKKGRFKHILCNHSFLMNIKDFLGGQRCPACAARIRKEKARHVKNGKYIGKTTINHTIDFWFDKINKKYHDEYILNERDRNKIISNSEKMELIHSSCSNIIYKTPKSILNCKSGCPLCNTGGRKNDIETVKEKFLEKGFELLDPEEYRGTHGVSKIKCIKCGLEQERSFNTIVNLDGRCECSKKDYLGESMISEYLEKNNYTFVRNKSFPDLKNKMLLRVDFFLENYNLIIEYDGKQHFSDVKFFSNSLEENRIRDIIKNDFAMKNNFGIVRISYKNNTYEKIKEVLDEYFRNIDDGKPYDGKLSRTVWVGGKSEFDEYLAYNS